MELCVGMTVKIKRSDGRVHSAVISTILPGEKFVNVDWFEDPGFKRKAVTIASILNADTGTDSTPPNNNMVEGPSAISPPKELSNGDCCRTIYPKDMREAQLDPMKPVNEARPVVKKITEKKKLKQGEPIDIKRSNGRTHSALISQVLPDTGKVCVEWFEANETKGKSFDIQTILQDNPGFIVP